MAWIFGLLLLSEFENTFLTLEYVVETVAGKDCAI
jgi:hypothetical protein